MINRDYTYCTGVDRGGVRCTLRNSCKRYNKKALNSDLDLYWVPPGTNNMDFGGCTYFVDKVEDVNSDANRLKN